MDPQNNSSDTQNVYIAIDSVNDKPVITGQTISAVCRQNHEYEIKFSYLTVTDIDNTINELNLIILPGANYTLTGKTTIKPSQDYTGQLAVGIKVFDGKDSSALYKFLITVEELIHIPSVSITSIPQKTIFGTTAQITIAYSDSGNDLDSIYVIADDKIKLSFVATGSNSTIGWKEPFNAYVIGEHPVMAVAVDKKKNRDTSEIKIVSIEGTFESDTLSFKAFRDSNSGIFETTRYITNNEKTRIVTIISESMGQWTDLLKSLPPEIGNLSELILLILPNGGSIQSIPAEIGRLKKLTSLILNGFKITSIPIQLTQLNNLTCLDLNFNPVNSIPKEIKNLTNLRFLGFAYNNISIIPQEILNLINLDSLDLSYNKLTSIPSNIGKLSNLEFFNLGSNQLTLLPSEIGSLKNLKALNLVYNNLTDLPSTIINLTNIKNLNINSNKLDTTHTGRPWEAWADVHDPDWRKYQDYAKAPSITHDQTVPRLLQERRKNEGSEIKNIKKRE